VRTPTAPPPTVPPPVSDLTPEFLDALAAADAMPPSAEPSPSAEQAPAAADDDSGLTWMDQVEEEHAGETPSPESLERSDVIRARDLQQNLMQQAPDLPGFSFATRYEPCTDISGDFYEFVRLADGCVGFALGDVSGHGMQAGLIMSMAKKTLEIYAAHSTSPADVLANVNGALGRDLGGKLFISMFYAILDPARRTITWARAGHNPGMRLNRRTGTLDEIKPKGMVVGMKSGATYRQYLEEQVTAVEDGDVFLLYTDGVTETMNRQNEEFGTDRLAEIIRQHADEGPDQLLSHIMDRVRHFRGGGPPGDDATLLAISVDAP
jgi:sigma-B regulation protein RsbU (phosphoserine phosphatase)